MSEIGKYFSQKTTLKNQLPLEVFAQENLGMT